MKRPWKIGLLLGLAVFGAVLFNLLDSPQQAIAANPVTMSFQGKVVNADGTNVADGSTYSILFKLYTVSSAGMAVWTETQTNVTVAGGVFQVNLGSICSFFIANACNNNTPIDFNANPNLYLGITFNGDAAGEMTPRPQLQSVPYAFQADNASKLGGLVASNYVQLSPDTQQTGSININGSGTFATGLLGPSLDVVSAATLNIGTATATALTLGKSGVTTTNGGPFVGNSTISASGYIARSGSSLTLQNATNDASVSWSNTGATTVAALRILAPNGIGINTATMTGTGLNLNASTNATGNSSIQFGTDTNFYRSGAATLKTDQSLIVGTNLSVIGAPTNSATSSLIQFGSPIVGGNVVTNGGTYLGINEPAAGNPGTVADFVNFQNNGVSKFKVDSTGIVTATTRYSVNGGASLTRSCGAGAFQDTQVISGGISVSSSGCNTPALSDQRLKTNVVSLSSSILDKIKNVRTVNFNFDCSNAIFSDDTPNKISCAQGLQAGVIAQELQQVFPELVYQDPNDGYFRVRYDQLAVYNLKAVTEIAQHLDSQGNASFNNVTVNHLTVNDGTTNTAETGNYTNSVVTPRLVSSGALVINSGSSGDVSIDGGSNSAVVNIGAANAAGVNIARSGSNTEVKGALAVDQAANFSGNVTMHFKDPDTSFNIDNSGSTQAVSAAIQIKDSTGSGYTSLISTPNFNVAGNGDISTGGSIISKGGSFQLLDTAGQQLISFDQSGSANFKGNLNLSSAALSGGLAVGGDVNVAGLSTFQKLATFIGKTIFRQDVQFDGHITVAGDSAGYAKLRPGESIVHVAFKAVYQTVPVVSANVMSGQFGLAGVNNVTKQGFDITLPGAATADTTLSWTAVAVTDPQTATNPLPAPVAPVQTPAAPASAPATSPTPAPQP